MTLELAGRRALVTGAAHGIGLAIARRLLELGSELVALDRDAAALHAALSADECDRVTADIGVDDPVELGQRILESFGIVSLIVNNVGVSTSHGFLDLDPVDFDTVFNTNVRGPWFLTRELVRALVDSGKQGSVLFISSVHDERVRLNPHYSASKAAIVMLVKELAVELGPHGIRVNAISPGWIRTEPRVEAGRVEALIERIPASRPGTPDDVARIATVLLSDQVGGYVTGARIPVDGGLSLHSWISDL